MAQILTIPARQSFLGIASVEPAAKPPEDYQTEHATGADFGAQVGQGEEKLGAGALTAGKFFGQVAAQDATNQFSEGLTQILTGDTTGPDGQIQRGGLMGLHGADFLNGKDAAQSRIDDLYKQTRSGLATPEQQFYFDEYSRRYRTMMMDRVGERASRESDAYASDTNNSFIDQMKNYAGVAALNNDPELTAYTINGMRGAFVKQAHLKGGDAADAILQADRAQSLASITALMSDPNRGADAQKMFNADRHLFAGTPELDTLGQRTEHAGDFSMGVSALANARAGIPLPGAGSTGAGAQPIGGAVPQAIAAEAARQNIDPMLALTTAHIESGMGQNLGSRGNIFQLGEPEKASVGGMGADAGSQIRGGVAFLAHTQDQLEIALGRLPTPAEVYLAHQQGVDGAVKLLSSPNTPAGQLVGGQAISANGGDPNAPASQFVSHWRDTFNRTAQGYAGGATAEQFAAAAAQPTGAGANGIVPAGAPGAPIGTPGGAFDHASGDSIAVQQIHHQPKLGSEADFKTGADLPGTARVGAGGPEILRRINDEIAADPKAFAGVNFLSSGASNDPAHVGYVGNQIDAMKKGGATAVVVPGVGPGVPNAAAVNASLKSVVEEHGGIFFQPQVKWQADGIHPAEVDKVRDQGLAAFRAAVPAGQPPGPDQIQGQPAAPTGVRPAGNIAPPQPASSAIPAPAQAPGLADIAQAELNLAQHHERTVANLAPLAASNPNAWQHANAIETKDFEDGLRTLAAGRQVLTENRNDAASGYARELAKPQIDPSIIARMRGDTRLDQPTLENLIRFYDFQAARGAGGDDIKYGAKYTEQVLGGLTAPYGDPKRIYDPSQLIAMAARPPNPDGTRDLSEAGLQQGLELLAKKKAGPEGVAELALQKSGLEYGKTQLEHDIGSEIDRRGAATFSGSYVPQFYKYWHDGIAAGKSPEELIDRKSLDKLITPLMRQPGELVRDQIDAADRAAQEAAKGAADFSNSPAAALLRNGGVTREQFDQKYGAGAAEKILGPAPPPAPVLPAAPIAEP